MEGGKREEKECVPSLLYLSTLIYSIERVIQVISNILHPKVSSCFHKFITALILVVRAGTLCHREVVGIPRAWKYSRSGWTGL